MSKQELHDGLFPGTQHWFSLPTHTLILEQKQSETEHFSTERRMTHHHQARKKSEPPRNHSPSGNGKGIWSMVGMVRKGLRSQKKKCFYYSHIFRMEENNVKIETGFLTPPCNHESTLYGGKKKREFVFCHFKRHFLKTLALIWGLSTGKQTPSWSELERDSDLPWCQEPCIPAKPI